MSFLQALNRAYDRLSEEGKVPPFGYSSQGISFCISLNSDGIIVDEPIDLRNTDGKKKSPMTIEVPQPAKRTVGIAPNYLWDKSSYVLGIKGNKDKEKPFIIASEDKRLNDEHQAFIEYHKNLFADTDDAGLKAFLLFLQNWNSDGFTDISWSDDVKKDIIDANIVFALEEERLEKGYLHNRNVARQIWTNLATDGDDKKQEICLIKGAKLPVARLHPAIKGVWGGQSAGGSIISFNLDAFTSYGHEQGDNAPTSEAAAFAYTSVLNKFLAKGSENRIQIGDASTVFWAEAEDNEDTRIAETIFPSLFVDEINLDAEEGKIKDIFDNIIKGKKVIASNPNLNSAKFYILGLSPNAARISIRFWYESTFGKIVENYQNFMESMKIEPHNKDTHYVHWKYMAEIAVLGKRENVPPIISCNFYQAILSGAKFPHNLLNNILTRINADGNINARRVAMIKAYLIRNLNSKEATVAFDPENTNKGYLLGRLFAIYERIQEGAIPNANATIKDKFYSSAAKQPRKIFKILDEGSANHLSKIRKDNKGREVYFVKLISDIMNAMSPNDAPFPVSLSEEEQGLFTLGYYHQRNEFFKSKEDKTAQEQA